MSLEKIVADINQGLFKNSPMKVGAIIDHPRGYKVKIISGSHLVDGRVSNFWYWKRVYENGVLGRTECGYGW